MTSVVIYKFDGVWYLERLQETATFNSMGQPLMTLTGTAILPATWQTRGGVEVESA